MIDFKKIEPKWQKKWIEDGTFNAVNGGDKEKYYILTEFPYPSGSGLHIGHPRSYCSLDAVARMKRMQGYNVLFPMGWDAFGAPAEQYAIKNKIHPKEAVKENVETFRRQMQGLGLSYDWSREFSTTDPEYYKWTQWQFLKFFEHGLAYKGIKDINWCPKCKTGLSNEDSEGGVCERCGEEVVQKEKEQWMLKMSEYSESLLEGLDDTDFKDKIKTAQINWIGKSTGIEISYKIDNIDDIITVFTTLPDTNFGATFLVIAPEHPLIQKYKDVIKNYDDVQKYIEIVKKKNEFERKEINKDKTGVRLEGIDIIHPILGTKIPVYISDYVLMGYGTGAVVGVPAHDERDYDFAIKFNIPIIPVIAEVTGIPSENEQYKKSIVAVVYDKKEDKYLTINWENMGGRLFIGGSRKEQEDIISCAKREIAEETGYINVDFIRETMPIEHHYFAHNKNQAFKIDVQGLLFYLIDDEKTDLNLDEEEKNNFKPQWVSKEIILKEVNEALHRKVYEQLMNPGPTREHFEDGEGTYINSGFLNGMTSQKDAIEKISTYYEEKGIGKRVTNYKLQDWIFSRQRFWGEPIPLVHCEKCGWVAVNEEDLPVLLPDVTEYEPTDDGESPLAKIENWVNTTCPKCAGPAKRETDTMPNWAGSSWYWLRYMDPHNTKEFASQDALKYWGKVDWYNGGMEHATRHLLYARFWNHFLYNIGLVPNKEPFKVRVSQGMILGSDGEKISKSKNNGVSPDVVIDAYGADALRTYIMFIGDYEKDAVWNNDGPKSVKKFLDRVARLKEKLNDKKGYTNEFIVNKTIKKVTNDMESMKYNTAVSSLMIMLNEYEKFESVSKDDYIVLLQLLNPIAPHITEELNEELGNSEISSMAWPIYDEAKLVLDLVVIGVQVNGKLRASIEVSDSMSEEEVKEKALMDENVKKHIEGKEIKKVIYINKKIVSIVTN